MLMNIFLHTAKNGKRKDSFLKKYSRLYKEPADERQMNDMRKVGFVAAGIFPPPVEYMSNIELPAGIPANGTTAHDVGEAYWCRMGCIS